MGSWLELRRNLIVKHVQVLKDDDMESGRVQTVEEAWAEIDAI